MEHPIINPQNPYVGTLRIFPGTLVKVAGRPRPNATRFAINFQTGPSLNPRDDLALHLGPCFTPPRVVRNSLRHGAWGLEEAWGNGTVVNPHQPFEIMILAEHDQFKIAINGAHYCEFKYRIPYPEITHLTIDGDVDIDRITITSPPDNHYTAPTPTAAYHPSAPPATNAPYPTGPSAAMPMPPMYPTLSGGPSGPYPSAVPGGYPPASMPTGPMPTGASYASGYPGGAQAPGGAYPPPPMSGQYPHMAGGPMPTGAGYQGGPSPAGAGYQGGPSPTGAGYGQGGYPQQPYHHQQAPQPGHSSSSPFGSLPIGGKALGTLAGLGLGAAAGAAVLSAANPLKHMKKMMKPKVFKHKGWGNRSSSSSNSSISSRSSFSSNSS